MVRDKQAILTIRLDKKGGSHIRYYTHCVIMTQPIVPDFQQK